MTVRITDPDVVGRVTYSALVRGAAPVDALVQLFVLARDGKWYLQAPVFRLAHRFIGRCMFGLPESEPGGAYRLVALQVREPVTTSPLDALPAAEGFWEVQVLRVAYDPSRPTGYDNPKPVGEGSVARRAL